MKIVRCPKCGKYIHKAVKCFHCGNTAGFEEISGSDVHENITQEYARMDILIEDKKIRRSHRIILHNSRMDA